MKVAQARLENTQNIATHIRSSQSDLAGLAGPQVHREVVAKLLQDHDLGDVFQVNETQGVVVEVLLSVLLLVVTSLTLKYVYMHVRMYVRIYVCFMCARHACVYDMCMCRSRM